MIVFCRVSFGKFTVSFEKGIFIIGLPDLFSALYLMLAFMVMHEATSILAAALIGIFVVTDIISFSGSGLDFVGTAKIVCHCEAFFLEGFPSSYEIFLFVSLIKIRVSHCDRFFLSQVIST